MSDVLIEVNTTPSNAAFDKALDSVPSSSETELQLNREQVGKLVGGSMAGADVAVDNTDASLLGREEEIVADGSEKQMVQSSRVQYHLRVIAEMEEFTLQHEAEKIIVPPSVRESLPPAVEALLTRLDSSSEDPVREFNREKDLRGAGFGTLFGGEEDPDFKEKFGQKPKEWAIGVRLLVMTAVGTCMTLEAIDVGYLHMTIQELKALLEPMQSNSVLRDLCMDENWIVGTKEGGKVVAQFLKVNQSLKTFSLLANEDSYLLHYLGTYGHPTLESLSVVTRVKKEDIGGGMISLDGERLKRETIADLIHACPNLQAMPRPRWKVEDEESAKWYAQVLMEHKSFCRIRVRGPAKSVSSLLLSACSGAHSITSLIGLHVEVTDNQWWSRNILSRVILANKHLEDISLDDVRTWSEEWQGVFRSLKQNAVLKSLQMPYQRFDEHEGFDIKAWAEMVVMVEESSQLKELSISKARGYQHDLRPFIAAVTSNKQIGHFTLEGFAINANENTELAVMVRHNTSLTYLSLMNSKVLNWEEIFDSLAFNITLKELDVLGSPFDDQALSALLTTLQRNSTLEKIVVGESHWEAQERKEIIEYALQREERQGIVTYAFISSSTENKAEVFRTLQKNDCLQCLYLSFTTSVSQFDINAWEALEALMEENFTLQSLIVFGEGEKGSQQNDFWRLFEIVSSNTSLYSLTLRNFHTTLDEGEALASLIKENTSLKQLKLASVKEINWERFFNSLRYNDTLHTLEFSYIFTLDEGAFKELQAALQVNSSLKTILLHETNWRGEGKDAIIREALDQKGRRDTYMAHMKATLEKEKYDVPNTGRLFLFGSPQAGKTQLRMALTQVAADRACHRRVLKSYVQSNHDLLRTQGIEIECLNIESLQISIWDLAGQDIFRALQDVLFPKLNLACVFLLVFSPFDHSTQRLKLALSDELYREFVPWLRFIASNSQITGHTLPKVSIVISHKDKLDMPNFWAEDVINTLRLQFAEVLDIEQKAFFTNSRGVGEDVHAVLNHTVMSFQNLLATKLFKVPVTCLTLGSFLAKGGSHSQTKVKTHFSRKLFKFLNSCLCKGADFAKYRISSTSGAKREPILSTSEFFELCQREVVSLQKINCSDAEGQKLMVAMADYLHDAGHIVQIAESDLVVVDPNWLTFSFMGRLVGSGHDFESPIIRVDRFKYQKDGHLSTAAFQELLRNFAQRLRQEGYNRVNEKLLETLMEKLDLSFYVPQESGYFAPALFAEEKDKRSSEGRRKLQDWQCVMQRLSMGRHISFVGIRVQCRDRMRTMMTASFFPRFQVHFRNLLISSHGLKEDRIRCDYNLLYIIIEEYEVYVESDGNLGDHIDILVRSPHSRTKTWKFIERNVVQEIQDFCASPKGCPGITLVQSVLRTECVEKLTLSVHRDNDQAILVEELKTRWKEHILCREVQSDILEEDLVDFTHLWPSNEEAVLTKSLEKARDLLTEKDFVDVLRSVKGTAKTLEKQIDTLKATEEEIEEEIKVNCLDVGLSNTQTGGLRISTLEYSKHTGKFPTSKDPSLQRAFSNEMMEKEKISYEVRKVGQKMDMLSKDFAEVKNILKDIQRDVKDVQCYQGELVETMLSMNGKLDHLIGFAIAEHSELPSRPYFTRSDVKWTHRIVSAVYVGRAMTLHFMCEGRSGNHIVSGQSGYPLTVLKENAEKLRFLCVNSLKILWYLLKAGVHVATGLGNVIPDLEGGGRATLLTVSALGNLLVESKMGVESKMVNSDPRFDHSRMSRESWEYLKQLVLVSLKGRCAEYFSLYRARYVAAPCHVWLCQDCLEKDRQSKAVMFIDE